MLAASLAVLLGQVLVPSPAVAATPDLTLVTDARYVVQPDHARVRVVVDIVATNHKPETVTRRFYYDNAYLAVLPGTSSFAVTANGTKPSVSIAAQKKDYTLLELAFGKPLYSGHSLSMRLAFDLKDPGGSPTRDVRIGTTLATFPVWAFASNSTPGSTVSVTFPAGYVPQLESGQFPPPTTTATGQIVYRTPPLADPLSFSAYFVAERPAAYVQTTRTAIVGQQHVALTLRAWPEDAAWAKRTGQIFATGLGALSAAIGLPIGTTHLTVEEAASRTIGGYAGLFDPVQQLARVAYSAGPFVALHEAAHAWFNGGFLADRWANEAFASYYADLVGASVGVTPAAEPMTPALEKSRIPLNAWGGVGQANPAVDDYAYAASAQLADLIAKRAGGAEALRAVWSAIAGHEAAYQPVTGTMPVTGTTGLELASSPPDWRSLLDLLEERTGRSFDDLWRTWVARPEEAALLDARASARSDYRSLLAEAGIWELPASIRGAMDSWRFPDAEALMATARTVLEARPALTAAAAAVGVALPDRLRQAFEGIGGPSGAVAELNVERETIADIADAEAAAAAPRDTLAAIGLLGASPDATLDDAKTAFTAGDLEGASREAAAATDLFTSAQQTGRGRAISALAAFASVSFLVAAAARQFRRRRRSHAHRVGAGGPGQAEPYATLRLDPAAMTSRGGIADVLAATEPLAANASGLKGDRSNDLDRGGSGDQDESDRQGPPRGGNSSGRSKGQDGSDGTTRSDARDSSNASSGTNGRPDAEGGHVATTPAGEVAQTGDESS